LFLKEFEINKTVRKSIPKQFRSRIVKIFRGFEEKKEVFLICDLMKGNLNDKSLEIMEIQKILEDISGLLKEMHKKGFVHFDISPGNLIRKYLIYSENEKKLWETGL
jgi:serine/threonine protein kinase